MRKGRFRKLLKSGFEEREVKTAFHSSSYLVCDDLDVVGSCGEADRQSLPVAHMYVVDVHLETEIPARTAVITAT